MDYSHPEGVRIHRPSADEFGTIRTPKGCEFIGLRPMNVWTIRTPEGYEFIDQQLDGVDKAGVQPFDAVPTRIGEDEAAAYAEGEPVQLRERDLHLQGCRRHCQCQQSPPPSGAAVDPPVERAEEDGGAIGGEADGPIGDIDGLRHSVVVDDHEAPLSVLSDDDAGAHQSNVAWIVELEPGRRVGDGEYPCCHPRRARTHDGVVYVLLPQLVRDDVDRRT